MNVNELDQNYLKKLGIQKPRNYSFTAENERKYAIKILAVISDLKQKERARVLKRSIQINNI